MASIFDLFQPKEKVEGLPGLALEIDAQGGQPQGLKQALGAGLLGASGAASQVLPGLVQDPSQGFGSTFATSFLAGIGGPARQAVASERDRQKRAEEFQQEMLSTSFRFLTPESQEKILSKVAGLQDLETKRDEQDIPFMQKEIIKQYVKNLDDPDPQVAATARAYLGALDEKIAPGLESAGFTFSRELTPTIIKGMYTPDSILEYYNQFGPRYKDITVLEPKEDLEGKLSPEDKIFAKDLEGVTGLMLANPGLSFDEAEHEWFLGEGSTRGNIPRGLFLQKLGQPAGQAALNADRVALEIFMSSARDHLLSGIPFQGAKVWAEAAKAVSLGRKEMAKKGINFAPQQGTGRRDTGEFRQRRQDARQSQALFEAVREFAAARGLDLPDKISMMAYKESLSEEDLQEILALQAEKARR